MAQVDDPTRARAAALKIVRRLRESGHEAFFAGGCVRDELLGRRPTDYDIATSARPKDVRGLFRPAHLVGEAFGVVLIPLYGCNVEVATYRGDGAYSDSRRPDSVTFGSIDDDAARRDFTINALYLDPDPAPGQETPGLAEGGRVIDLVGGVADLQAGVLRAVGDPEQRLAEDHLRALRAVRFACRFGFTIEAATRQAVARHARDLRGVSRERIGQELSRMMSHPARAAAAADMQELGLDAVALDEPGCTHDPRTLRGLATLPPQSIGVGLALAAWAFDRHEPGGGPLGHARAQEVVRRWRRALCLSNLDRDRMGDAIEMHDDLVERFEKLGVAQQKRLAAREAFDDAVALIAGRRPEFALLLRERAEELARLGPGVAPNPLVSGDDLISLGLKPGPAFKKLLDHLYDEQLEGRFNTRNKGLTMARELAARWGV